MNDKVKLWFWVFDLRKLETVFHTFLLAIFLADLGESFIKWKQMMDRWEHEYIADWEANFHGEVE